MVGSRRTLRGLWTTGALRVARAVGALSRRLGLGSGGMIGGRVLLALDPRALTVLAQGRRTVLVSGTNGKTTTSHLIAAALRTLGPVAHNDSGANMPDGVVAALAENPDAPYAVLEVDELYLGAVADAVRPDVMVLLNLTRDQLDRGYEVQAVAAGVSAALAAHPDTVVVANLDDPVVVGAVGAAEHIVWVATGVDWEADAVPGESADTVRPAARWRVQPQAVRGPEGATPVRMALPGRFNLANAALAMAAVASLGVPQQQAAEAFARVGSISGRYAVHQRGAHTLRLLLAKNPAGWTELLPLLEDAPALLLAINAREADGRDTSWLWDVPFERLGSKPIAASGERAPDVGLRLSYADVGHVTERDPLAALDLLPEGEVRVVANYTAFAALRRRLAAENAAPSESVESAA
jgi:UDP-N-acetylmuramyl tripeptide synthase